MRSVMKPSSVSAFVKGGEGGKGMWAKRKHNIHEEKGYRL